MGKVIAVTGKGGAGKTTVAVLIVKSLIARRLGPILAVDADPNTNLDAALGVVAAETVGDIREEALAKVQSLPGGMTKTEFLQYRTQEALVEADGFDLIAMGRPEGPGCYCYANSILRACVDQLTGRYPYVVMDCEAGLEHLSRRTTQNVDLLLMLSDVSVRGLETAARVVELVEELKTEARRMEFAVTRVRNGLPDQFREAVAARHLTIAAEIPDDPEIAALDAAGRPLLAVSAGSAALAAVQGLLDKSGVLE